MVAILRAFALALAAAVYPIAAQSTIYFPILSPTPDNPWVVGGTNILAWRSAGGTGILSFDVQLHNPNTTVMNGFLDLALRVPLEKLPTGYRNYGGEMEVDLSSAVPTGDGFYLIFLDSLHGQVYAKSKKFSIYPSAPSNYSTVSDLPTATVTISVTNAPNPTEGWAATLNGVDNNAATTAATTTGGGLAGNAGSGQRRRDVA